MIILDAIGHWFRSGIYDGWTWVRSLSDQEWLFFLAITSCLGFLCMRGYGSRANY